MPMTLDAAMAEKEVALGVLLAQVDTILAAARHSAVITKEEVDRLRAHRDRYDKTTQALNEALGLDREARRTRDNLRLGDAIAKGRGELDGL